MNLLGFGSKDTRVIWGHTFIWTSDHLTPGQLAPLLYSYDTLATEALDRLDQISPPTSNSWKCPHNSGPGQRDLYNLLQTHAPEDQVLSKLWHEVSTVPEWVDWDQIHRGQRIVYQYSGQILLGLLFKSLLGGMAAWRVVETLSRTGGFGVNVTRRRLLETLQHFIQVIADLDSVKPGGDAFESSVRVRLLHAAVRRRIMALEKEKPGYFDVDAWGVPINDLHSIGTVCAYSTSLVYMALPRQGVVLREDQVADYFALWRWVGHLLGTPVDWMATPRQVKIMYESVMAAEIQPSANSQILANNILTAEARVPPLYAPREYLAAQAYRLNGADLASALGIAQPSLYYRSLVRIQCLTLMFLSALYPYLPLRLQQRRDKRFMAFSHHMITSQKLGGLGEPTTFAFQYIPQLGMLTAPGVRDTTPEDRDAGRAVQLLRVTAMAGVVAVSVGVAGWLRGLPQHLIAGVMTRMQSCT